MKRVATTMLALLLASVATTTLTAPARAALRSPQVPVLGGSLQAFLNLQGETINVNTDQDATQTWSHTISGTTSFTLMFESTPNANGNSFGMYNGGAVAPPLYLLIAGPIIPQGFSTATFQPGPQIVVNRFDDNGIPIGSQTFLGVDPTNFGLYIQTPTGATFYTQHGCNPGGKAQAVVYRGTGPNLGTWWVCFDDQSVNAGSDQDYDDCVVLCESINPTPVSSTSWGQLKARFR